MTDDRSSVAAIAEWLVAAVAAILEVPAETIDPTGSVDIIGLQSIEVVILAGDLSEHLGWEVDVDLLLFHDTLAEVAAEVAAAAP